MLSANFQHGTKTARGFTNSTLAGQHYSSRITTT
jgi:hypothetical protein